MIDFLIKLNEITKTFNKANVRIWNMGQILKLDIQKRQLWKCKGPRITRTIWKKNTEYSNPPTSKLIIVVSVIKTMWSQPKDRNIDQKNRTESLEVNSYICSQMTFDRGVKAVQWKKEKSFQLTEVMVFRCKRMKLEPFLTPHTKINYKMNCRP